MWQKDAFSDDAWRCRVCQWRWMAKCSRHAAQRWRTRGHQSSYDTKTVWQGQTSTKIAASFLYPRPPHDIARSPSTTQTLKDESSTESLNSIRSGTRSQWRSRSSGVMYSYFNYWLSEDFTHRARSVAPELIPFTVHVSRWWWNQTKLAHDPHWLDGWLTLPLTPLTN